VPAGLHMPLYSQLGPTLLEGAPLLHTMCRMSLKDACWGPWVGSILPPNANCDRVSVLQQHGIHTLC
jgi:hypothetical protein